MAIPSSYLVSTKNLPAILEQIQKGKVPSKFTYDHLKQLGFPSSNDRPIIPLLKALSFLDDSGQPQDRYRRFKDTTGAKRVMAEGIRDAYTDVFAIDEEAQGLSPEEIKGIFARLSDKGEAVTEKMAKTFRALVDEADFSPGPGADEPVDEGNGEDKEPEQKKKELKEKVPKEAPAAGGLNLHHDVHVHLPATDDIKVYDAIFRSLKEHLAT